VNAHGRTIWIADAHRDNGRRFVKRAEEKLTAFMELESAIRGVVPYASIVKLRRELQLVEKRDQEQ
jgi:hypothetical protein